MPRRFITAISVTALILTFASCGDDDTPTARGTTTLPPATAPASTTTAPGLLELAMPICGDFIAEYRAAQDRPIVQTKSASTEPGAFLVMVFAEDQPYANSLERLEALSLTDATDQADVARLIEAMKVAEEANASEVAGNADPGELYFALKELETIAGELGLSDCADLRVSTG
jgi:hypothetical protein